MIPYDHPVYKHGKRMLWHGDWRRGGSRPAEPAERAVPSPKPTTADRDIIVVADPQDACGLRMAGELVDILRGAGLKGRVVPASTAPGSISRSVTADAADLMIAPMDALLADDKASASWRERAPYVARLANEPIEIVASRAITDVSQLKDKQVSLGLADDAAASSVHALLTKLDVKPREVHESLAASMADLAAGKIDAVIVVGAAKNPAVADFGKGGHFHILAIPWSPALRGVYAPARVTAKDRPNLIGADEKIDTVAAPMALLAIDAPKDSARAPEFAAIVAAFFPKFDALLGPNSEASWRDVNLAASLDWPRLIAAREWIATNQGVTDPVLDAFRGLAHSVAASNGGPVAADAEKLYQSLMQWRASGP
jgi:TRAP-type uncharacterized transport system substrate-binding protein